MRAIVRRHGAFLALLALAILLRAVRLGDWPAPAGDEGNWTGWALALHRGEPVEMPEAASFVSLGFARLLALSFDLFGPGFAAARAVNALAGCAAVVGIYLAFASRGARREGLFAAAVLAVHPWSLAWSRTAAVPYALALASTTIGACLYARGLEARRPALVAAAIPVLALGAHVSPLSIVAVLPCAVLTLQPGHLWVLRSPRAYLGLALGIVLAAGPIRGALHVAGAVAPTERALSLGAKLMRLGHALATGLAGEATLRHFGGAALSVPLALLPAALVLVAIGAAFARRSEASLLGRLGLLWLALGVLVVPAVLAPARLWYLPDIDRERYLFALLPGLALVVGDAASARAPCRRGLSLAVLAWLAIASLRLGVDAFVGGGPDRGADVFAGGAAYRGFRVAEGGRAPAETIADRIARELPRGSGVVLAEASMRPIGFALARRFPRSRHGHPAYFMAEAEYFSDPYTYGGELAFVLWSPAVFDARPTAEDARRKNEELRRRMRRDYEGVRRIARLRQPDGRGLIEVYRARRPGERPWAF